MLKAHIHNNFLKCTEKIMGFYHRSCCVRPKHYNDPRTVFYFTDLPSKCKIFKNVVFSMFKLFTDTGTAKADFRIFSVGYYQCYGTSVVRFFVLEPDLNSLVDSGPALAPNFLNKKQ